MKPEDRFIGKDIGNYRIVATIASGAFGSVYQAQHQLLTSRIVAVKLLHAYLGSEEDRQQFLREAQFLEHLHHPHILPLLDVGFMEGLPYLIAEYAAQGSLRQRLAHHPGQPLSWETSLTILSQIGQALHYAHQQNIIHCDLKPENILFTSRGEALLADFGIATMLITGSVKLTAVTGTPSYMAPEQFQGQVSQQSDQYALGCIAYELATGQRPFTAPDFISMGFAHATKEPLSPRQLNASLSPQGEQAILKAMAKQRRDRHVDSAAFITALQTPTHSSAVQTPILPSSPSTPSPTADLSPTTKAEWMEEGNAQSDLKRYEESLEVIDQTLRLDPNLASAYNVKGVVLSDLKRYEEALAAFEQALRLDPNFAYAYNHKGVVLRELKRYEEALVVFEQALRLNPNYVSAYYNKGNLLRWLKRHEEAQIAFDQARRLDPNLTSY